MEQMRWWRVSPDTADTIRSTLFSRSAEGGNVNTDCHILFDGEDVNPSDRNRRTLWGQTETHE